MFSPDAVSLTQNGMPVAVGTAPTLTFVSGTTYRLGGLGALTRGDGTYQLSLSLSSVQDLAGNPGIGGCATSWVMSTTPPAPPTGLAIDPDRGLSATDGVTNTGSVTFHGTLSEPGLSVLLFDTTCGNDLGAATVSGTTFSAALTLAEGRHHIRARALHPGGSAGADSFFDVVVDQTQPGVAAVTPVAPNPRNTSVSSIRVTFTEPIDVTTFDPNDIESTATARFSPGSQTWRWCPSRAAPMTSPASRARAPLRAITRSTSRWLAWPTWRATRESAVRA